jgi:hypothetical protein
MITAVGAREQQVAVKWSQLLLVSELVKRRWLEVFLQFVVWTEVHLGTLQVVVVPANRSARSPVPGQSNA